MGGNWGMTQGKELHVEQQVTEQRQKTQAYLNPSQSQLSPSPHKSRSSLRHSTTELSDVRGLSGKKRASNQTKCQRSWEGDLGSGAESVSLEFRGARIKRLWWSVWACVRMMDKRAKGTFGPCFTRGRFTWSQMLSTNVRLRARTAAYINGASGLCSSKGSDYFYLISSYFAPIHTHAHFQTTKYLNVLAVLLYIFVPNAKSVVWLGHQTRVVMKVVQRDSNCHTFRKRSL